MSKARRDRRTRRRRDHVPNRPAPTSEYAVSDEAAAYIADALMDLALQFEAAHFAQIRRHHQSLAHDQQPRDHDPLQLELFRRDPPF